MVVGRGPRSEARKKQENSESGGGGVVLFFKGTGERTNDHQLSIGKNKTEE